MAKFLNLLWTKIYLYGSKLDSAQLKILIIVLDQTTIFYSNISIIFV